MSNNRYTFWSIYLTLSEGSQITFTPDLYFVETNLCFYSSILRKYSCYYKIRYDIVAIFQNDKMEWQIERERKYFPEVKYFQQFFS